METIDRRLPLEEMEQQIKEAIAFHLDGLREESFPYLRTAIKSFRKKLLKAISVWNVST